MLRHQTGVLRRCAAQNLRLKIKSATCSIVTAAYTKNRFSSRWFLRAREAPYALRSASVSRRALFFFLFFLSFFLECFPHRQSITDCPWLWAQRVVRKASIKTNYLNNSNETDSLHDGEENLAHPLPYPPSPSPHPPPHPQPPNRQIDVDVLSRPPVDVLCDKTRFVHICSDMA